MSLIEEGNLIISLGLGDPAVSITSRDLMTDPETDDSWAPPGHSVGSPPLVEFDRILGSQSVHSEMTPPSVVPEPYGSSSRLDYPSQTPPARTTSFNNSKQLAVDTSMQRGPNVVEPDNNPVPEESTLLLGDDSSSLRDVNGQENSMPRSSGANPPEPLRAPQPPWDSPSRNTAPSTRWRGGGTRHENRSFLLTRDLPPHIGVPGLAATSSSESDPSVQNPSGHQPNPVVSNEDKNNNNNNNGGDVSTNFILPQAILGARNTAKQTLHVFYGQMPEMVQLSKKDYFPWHNGAADHIRRFTCIFMCPVTGEWFPSGRYGNDYKVVPDLRTGAAVVWYAKKLDAEHAAAARAYDCLCFRSGCDTQRLSTDLPYLGNVSIDGIPTIPPEIEEMIENRDAPRRRFREDH